VAERFESSTVGRVLISVFVLATLLAIVVWNLPDSKLRRQGLHAARPYVKALGLDQNWAVFAPDPRAHTIALEARLTYADGSTRTWRLPASDDVIGSYWDYRWLKWAEWTIVGRSPNLPQWTAEFVVRRELGAGRHPRRIRLVSRWRELYAPPDGGMSPWSERVILDRSVAESGPAS
jgi:hypothetical protein